MDRNYKKNIILLGILALTMAIYPKVNAQAFLGFGSASAQGQVLGDSAPYPSGTLVNDGGTIYFIYQNTKIPFTNYAAFKGLGYSLKNVVKGDTSSYSVVQGYSISTANAAHPWGTWLSYKNTIYYSSEQGLVGVPNAEIFTSNGGQWNLVVKANKYDIAAISSDIPLLTDNDSRVEASAAYGFSGGQSSQNTAPVFQPTTVTAVPSPTPSMPVLPTAVGTLNTPTLATGSPASQFVLGSTNSQNIALFNFTASGGPVTITELDFTVTGTFSAPNVLPVNWIMTGGGVAPALGATSTVANLNLLVPNNASGLNVPVSATLAQVNGSSVPANQLFSINLVGIKYTSGGATSFVNINVPANTMDLVSGYPSVLLTNSNQTLTDNSVDVARVTVSAMGTGGIVLNQIPIKVTSSGNAFVTATASNVSLIDDTTGFAVNITPISFGLATSSSNSAAIILNDDNTIATNNSKTYDIYLPVTGALGISAGSSSITTALEPAASFIFSNNNGGSSGSDITGSQYILGYPTNSVTIHN